MADPFDPQILNRYTYVRNNPSGAIDPSGASFFDLFETTSDGGSGSPNLGADTWGAYPPADTFLETGPGPEQFDNAQSVVLQVQSPTSVAGALSVGAGFTAVRSGSGTSGVAGSSFDPAALAGRLNTFPKMVFGGLAIAVATFGLALYIAVNWAGVLQLTGSDIVVAAYTTAPAAATAIAEGVAGGYAGTPIGVNPIPLGAGAVREAEELAAGGIATSRGVAGQATSDAALAARAQVSEGATLWRMGTTNRSAAAEAQYWSLENPLSPGFASRYGVPAENIKIWNFIESATLRPGTPFVTRQAPAVGQNLGGGIEVVVPEGGVTLRSFSHLGY